MISIRHHAREGWPAVVLLLLVAWPAVHAHEIQTSVGPGQLDVRVVSATCLRITLKPVSYEGDFPVNPALSERDYPAPAISLQDIDAPVTRWVGGLDVRVSRDPLTVQVSRADGSVVQRLAFDASGELTFLLDERPVLGLGEGGPLPRRGERWRESHVEYDRRGRVHSMRPRWQGGAYGSRNPVPLMIGVKGWGLYVASPWGAIDLTRASRGVYSPSAANAGTRATQTQGDQQDNRGKGLPPLSAHAPGLYDVFVFDAQRPTAMLRDLATVSGSAVMPPRWAMGYMQSHRTLEDDAQMIAIVDTFRAKQIPLDAVIYLGTGFTPRGWNTPQPSFEFNPDVFKHSPQEVIAALHERNVRVILHMVPWDRDKLPTLRGSIPPSEAEELNPSHIAEYWKQHIQLVDAGVDAWWPDEGDWFNLFERLKRHQMYYQGPLATRPNVRPWSLHRNGYLGIARHGGWVWSGDTESSWKSLEAQLAVGVNHSLSLSPFWGSDIGGFYPSKELTGELYARWFQFGAFTPSFRSHGRTWWTRLPWGWGLSELGPLESNTPPDPKELKNAAIEPIAKQYAELRYKLLTYNYTLAWQAHAEGLPMMRAMWVHYPEDPTAAGLGDQYLWGRDLLVAPVYQRGATERRVYLPRGEWYDWWTNEKLTGGRWVVRPVDLSTMPLYVRAGAVLPIDPVRQYTSQRVDRPLALRIYRGADGSASLYEDDGQSLDYLENGAVITRMLWDDGQSKLNLQRDALPERGAPAATRLRVELLPDGESQEVELLDSAEIRFGAERARDPSRPG
ncbi:MAG: glycoside hydrolase family 31 protein [Planctomycetales bacterium]|nr:glycoside hydrolase family 31 protein [Planctomycetales bacterium]